jgi:hypothetical protein
MLDHQGEYTGDYCSLLGIATSKQYLPEIEKTWVSYSAMKGLLFIRRFVRLRIELRLVIWFSLHRKSACIMERKSGNCDMNEFGKPSVSRKSANYILLSLLLPAEGSYLYHSPLKGPKLEIFGFRVFSQIRTVWVGDLGTRQKNSKF